MIMKKKTRSLGTRPPTLCSTLTNLICCIPIVPNSFKLECWVVSSITYIHCMYMYVNGLMLSHICSLQTLMLTVSTCTMCVYSISSSHFISSHTHTHTHTASMEGDRQSPSPLLQIGSEHAHKLLTKPHLQVRQTCK